MMPVHDWHVVAWQQLQQRRQQGQLPHALLLTGPAGIGKHALALNFAQSLLCQQPAADGQACQQCPACERVRAGSHPDLLRIEPEEEGKPIKVGQVRDLIDTLALASHYGGYRIVVMQPADAMNTSAANSFLKTLEEPPAKTILILVSAMPSRLPATIRSRCQLLALNAPSPEQALNWLQQTSQAAREEIETALTLSEGAPLLAAWYLEHDLLRQRQDLLKAVCDSAQHKQDALSVAALMLKLDPRMPINWLYSWTADLIRLKHHDEKYIKNKDLKDTLHMLSEQVDLKGLYLLLDKLQQARRLIETQVNQQLMWEEVLIMWSRLFPANMR